MSFRSHFEQGLASQTDKAKFYGICLRSLCFYVVFRAGTEPKASNTLSASCVCTSVRSTVLLSWEPINTKVSVVGNSLVVSLKVGCCLKVSISLRGPPSLHLFLGAPLVRIRLQSRPKLSFPRGPH